MTGWWDAIELALVVYLLVRLYYFRRRVRELTMTCSSATDTIDRLTNHVEVLGTYIEEAERTHIHHLRHIDQLGRELAQCHRDARNAQPPPIPKPTVPDPTIRVGKRKVQLD